ncbi:MAG TPA: GAF domain-containing protein [Anaerolineae bacterium]|nr:GAF domain-containing protein [Anaerolineae bacterium]
MRLTVGQRLVLPFVLIAILLVSMGIFSTYSLVQLNGNTEEILREHQPVLTNIAAIESGVLFHSLKVEQYVTTGNRAHLRTVAELRSDVEANLADLEDQTRGTEGEHLVQKIRETYDTYITMSDGLQDFYRRNPDDGASVAGRQMRIAALLENALLANADVLYETVQIEAQELIQANGRLYQTYFGITVTSGLVLAGLAIVLSLLISRSIRVPISQLVEATQRVAGGDLSARAQVKTHDEIGLLANDFNSMAAQIQELIGTLEQRVEERTRGLQTAAEVARATISVLDPNELLRQVVVLVRERFDLYYVGLFLLNEEGTFAVLDAGTGEAGKKMLEQGHRLEVGGNSMIGQCTARNEARIALDVGEEADRFENPLLPETRSEMALPLRSRGQVIGAMTVQSTEEAAFDEADIAVMQTMADQVAVAIDNARLFANAQTTLEEMEAINRRYLGQAWREYTRSRATSGYEQTDAGITSLGDRTLPDVQQVMSTRQPLITGTHGDNAPSAVLLPITLRGQPVGALGLEVAGGEQQWSDDDIALAEAVAEQLALAADNLRLLDETQRRAARERLVGDITDRMRETLDVDTVLQTAVREMRQILDLAEAEVRLGTGPASGKTGDGAERGKA